MKPRFTLFRRGSTYYCQDTSTGQQTSLRTKDENEATTLLHTKNEAFRQPLLNLQIARTYLSATDPEIGKRTWAMVMVEMGRGKAGVTLTRHTCAMNDRAFDLIRHVPVLETQATQFMRVLEAGRVSTNVFLRRLHNFALGMNWLPWPILAKKLWPKISYKEKRAVTASEHQRIVAAETNPERRAFYEACWNLGGSQTDIVNLEAGDIDWTNRLVSFRRQKTGTSCVVRFGDQLTAVFQSLPRFGPLFPEFRLKRETHRSCEFARACRRLGNRAAESPRPRVARCNLPELRFEEIAGACPARARSRRSRSAPTGATGSRARWEHPRAISVRILCCLESAPVGTTPSAPASISHGPWCPIALPGFR